MQDIAKGVALGVPDSPGILFDGFQISMGILISLIKLLGKSIEAGEGIIDIICRLNLPGDVIVYPAPTKEALRFTEL